MKPNVGTIDRAVRILFAVIVAVLFFTNQISGLAAAVLGVLAGIFFLTALAGICPIYSAIGLSSKKS